MLVALGPSIIPADLMRKLIDPDLFGLTLLDQYYLQAADNTATDELEVDTHIARVSPSDEGAFVQCWAWIPFPEGQWITICPNCGAEPLLVTKVTLLATGREVYLNTPLCNDGFEVNHPDTARDGSTEDEHVLCTKCYEAYLLSDLAIEEDDEPGHDVADPA
jgi:hypothetical protein